MPHPVSELLATAWGHGRLRQGRLAFRLPGVAPFLVGAWSGTLLVRNERGKQALGLLSGLGRGAAPEIRPGPARRNPHLTRPGSTHAWPWEAWRLAPPPLPLVRGELKAGSGHPEHLQPSCVCNLIAALDLEPLRPSPETPRPPLLRASEKRQPRLPFGAPTSPRADVCQAREGGQRTGSVSNSMCFFYCNQQMLARVCAEVKGRQCG